MPANFDITSLVGLSENQLLAIRTSVVSQLTTGSAATSISSVSTRDLSTTFSIHGSPTELLQAVSYALHQLDPDKYPATHLTKVGRYWVI